MGLTVLLLWPWYPGEALAQPTPNPSPSSDPSRKAAGSLRYVFTPDEAGKAAAARRVAEEKAKAAKAAAARRAAADRAARKAEEASSEATPAAASAPVAAPANPFSAPPPFGMAAPPAGAPTGRSCERTIDGSGTTFTVFVRVVNDGKSCGAPLRHGFGAENRQPYASLVITHQPAHGTVAINASVFAYTPKAGYHGADAFELTGDQTAVFTVNVTIVPP